MPNTKSLTRRQFLAAGAAAGLAAASCSNRGMATLACEVAVIGSGFAGTFLGLRLAELGIDTVIVDAGVFPNETPHRTGIRGHNAGGVWYPIDSTRHIGVGGTSQLWTGVVCRLLPDDFRLKSTYGFGADWPIAYDDLAPYYCQAEQRLNVAGASPVPDAEPPRTCAYPIKNEVAPLELPGDLDGIRPKFATMAFSTGATPGEPVRIGMHQAKEFEALTHGRLMRRRQAMRLVSKNGTVEHLVTRSLFEDDLAIQAKVYVLAAGTFENARILLSSAGDAHPQGMGNQSGRLGKHFNGHPEFIRKMNSTVLKVSPAAHRTYSYQERMRRAGMNACAFQSINPGDGTLDWRALPEMEASEKNAATLSATKRDRFDEPQIALDFNYSDRDQATFEEGRRILDAVESAYSDGSRVTEEEVVWRSHPAGTTRMGATPEDGVVDADNKVFGTDNVYVSGASVFPSSGTPNPTCTVVALTLRLADRIARTHFGKNA